MCSNRAVSTLREGDDATTGIKAPLLHERVTGATKKEKNVQFTKKKKINVDGHASDPHISSRETAASLVQRSNRPHSSTKLLL